MVKHKKERFLKLKCIFNIFLLLLFFNFVKGISLEMKDSYEASETMLIKIDGEVIQPIKKEQILFKRKHVLISPEFGIEKIGEEYYIWAVAPSASNNYSIAIKDVQTFLNGKPAIVTIERNFSVSPTLAEYFIRPGAVNSYSDFEISVWLNNDSPKMIDVDFPYNRNILLYPGENKIKFSLNKGVGAINKRIKIGKYELPAYLISLDAIEEETGREIKNETPFLIISPLIINKTISPSKIPLLYFDLINIFNVSIKNISVKINGSIFNIISNVSAQLLPGQKESFVFEIKVSKDINEKVVFYYENVSREAIVRILFVNNQTTNISNISEKNQSSISDGGKDYSDNKFELPSCAYVPGEICLSDESCDGETTMSKEGLCCKGKCIKKSELTSKREWIGIIFTIIMAIVLLFILYIYFKKKKQSKSVPQLIKK